MMKVVKMETVLIIITNNQFSAIEDQRNQKIFIPDKLKSEN